MFERFALKVNSYVGPLQLKILRTIHLENYTSYTAKRIHFKRFFFLNSLGPSFLLLSPKGTQALSLFLHFSSNLDSVVGAWSQALSRMVNSRYSLITVDSWSIPSPTMVSLCCLMQWVARLQVSLPHLMWLLWLLHLGFGLSVWPM